MVPFQTDRHKLSYGDTKVLLAGVYSDEELYDKPAHAVPLASARQRPATQKKNQADHSSERAVEGQLNEQQTAICPIRHQTRPTRPGEGAPGAAEEEIRNRWGASAKPLRNR